MRGYGTREKETEAAVGQGPVSPSMDTHNNILELFCRFWNAQVWEKSWYAAHKDVDSRPVKPEGWWHWLLLNSPPTHQKNVQELITPSFTIKRHYLPQVGEWFWGHELAVPPLPDKAIKLSFSISPKMLSLRFDLAPVYREAEFLHQQECLLFIMGSLTTPDSLCYWGNL